MDSYHLRFNQSDGSISFIVQTGFLAKNQLPPVIPDPIFIPSLARTCKRENSDRLTCPIRSLKFCLKMTSSYCQNRTRLAYRKLTKRDISFLKIKAHEVRALLFWAFFDKVPLNEILQAAVWS